MARRWYNEDYRKIYTRQDGEWLSLPWCARGLAADLIRWANDKGVVAVLSEEGDTEASAIASVVRAKPDEFPVIERAVRALLKDGYLVRRGDKVAIRNFVDAQERLSQDAARKRRQRDKAERDAAEDAAPIVTESESPTGAGRDINRDNGGTTAGHSTVNVTPEVTQMSAVSCRVVSCRDEKQIPLLNRVERVAESDLAAVYERYPRRIGRKKGLAIARREVKTAQDLADYAAAVDAYAAEVQADGRPEDKIAHFSTFMGRWRDHVPAAESAQQGRLCIPDPAAIAAQEAKDQEYFRRECERHGFPVPNAS